MTTSKFADVSPHTVPAGTIVWLKGCQTAALTTFLDILVSRGLDMLHVGSGDRYVVCAGAAAECECVRCCKAEQASQRRRELRSEW